MAQALLPAGSRLVSTLFAPEERPDEPVRCRKECLRHVGSDVAQMQRDDTAGEPFKAHIAKSRTPHLFR